MPERQCAGCTKKKEWGCTAIRWKQHEPHEPDHPGNWVRPAQLPVTVKGEESYACPRQHLFQNQSMWAAIFKFYGPFRKGHLPQTGAVADQSNKALEVFRVLDEANEAADRVEQEKRVAASNKRGRPPTGNGKRGR